MDFRTIIGFVLLAAIYFAFFAPSPPPQNLKQKSEQEQAANQKELSPPTDPKIKTETTQRVISKQSSESKLRGEEFLLENKNIQVFVNGLGEVQSVTLKNYTESVESDVKIKWDFNEWRGLNRGVLTANDELPSWKLSKSTTSKSLILEAQVSGARIERRIFLEPESYILGIEDSILNQSRKTVRTAYSLQMNNSTKGVEEPSLLSMFKPQDGLKELAVWNDGSVWRQPFLSVEGESDFDQPIHWAGFSYKYFFQGVVPKNVSIESVKSSRQGETVKLHMQLADKQIVAGEKSSYLVNYYLGPKDMDQLIELSPDLNQVIDYGDWVGPIARLLLQVLHFFHNLIPNYGVAIILLTLLVKSLLFPLSYKAAASMRKLSIVQPKMKEIKDKYKNDKQRMQSEMMALYRNEKVNPVGGCLPMFLQFPIFIALYRVFYASIELRQEPFVGWITDMSLHDPFFVTPVLMTALMWAQQKLTPMPTPSDDNEAVKIQMAMMKWMPIIFGVIMLWLPAGLTLYFLVNAGLSVVQQYYLNKHLDKISPRPALETNKAVNGN